MASAAEIPLLISALREPQALPSLDLGAWDLLIRQARHAGLLGRLHAMVEEEGLVDRIPVKPMAHLLASRVEADRVNLAACWEAGQIAYTLERLAVPIIVLKGGAYALAGLQAAKGRAYADLDILVPKSALAEVERTLQANGWLSTHLDAYDQRYYRDWMHEIPPMRHMQRHTNLDVHHGLLPETVRRRPDPGLLLGEAVPVEGLENVHVLSPRDMWLHSAVHLFQEGEFHHALRDLSDLDRLAREFAREQGFWEALAERMETLEVERQAAYALFFSHEVFGTPVPDWLLERVARHRPPQPMAGLMHALLRRIFTPLHPSARLPGTALAEWLLYVRSHAIRMPPHLLIPHLFHKGVVVPWQDWRKARRERREQIEALRG